MKDEVSAFVYKLKKKKIIKCPQVKSISFFASFNPDHEAPVRKGLQTLNLSPRRESKEEQKWSLAGPLRGC